MKIFITAFLGLFTFAYGTTQDLFLKTYHFPVNVRASTVKSYDQRLFVLSHKICESVECSFLTELNMLGDTIWTTLITDVDGAPNTMVIVNDTITVTGNNDPFNTAFRMAHFTLDGEKIGETIEIEHPTRKFTRMFQLTTQYFNGKYVICGPGWEGDTAWSLMYVVSKSGKLDTLITLEPTNSESDLWDSYIDNQGRLTTIHQVEWAFSPINYRRIYKFDLNYNTVWSYKTENDQYDPVIPYGCGLNDGRTILSVRHPTGGHIIHSIRAINTDKTTSWQYNYPFSGSRGRYVLRLKALSNGDIMGSGLYSEQAQEPRISDSPWLFRMSPEGELLWERTYFDIDSTIGQNGSSRIGALFDFIELEDGDIMAVGYFRYEDNDMLVMRVDSNGCLDPEDCHTVNILTRTDELPLRGNHEVVLYPNPVQDNLLIEFESNEYQLDVEILDMTGLIVIKEILTNGQGAINTSKLPAGVYWIKVKHDGRVLASRKFVKIEE
ncbi:MAG TPA: T9SS type A sorting domain-containing protein [Saprospiraceae bacterium]|nr:T9SS type A sorting domain-containing protein [Saprospiraceae bacterium]